MNDYNQLYEIYIAYDTSLSQAEVESKINSLTEFLEKKYQASNFEIENQGIKKFAYPIKHHRSGTYVLLNFEVPLENVRNINNLNKKFNLESSILRYIILNRTEFFKQKKKERPNPNPEFTYHREMNKGSAKKHCIIKYLGLKVVDYKDVDFLRQFTSPYAKIFSRHRTGTSAKHHRQINTALKQARLMALLPFTTKHY